MGTGMARVSTPVMAHAAPTSLPRGPTGTLSPYPTVVIVMIAHQKASGMLGKRKKETFKKNYGKKI